MSQRIRDRLTDRDTIESRGERFRRSHQLGEFIDGHTTVFGITPCHPNAKKRFNEILDNFLYGEKNVKSNS